MKCKQSGEVLFGVAQSTILGNIMLTVATILGVGLFAVAQPIAETTEMEICGTLISN